MNSTSNRIIVAALLALAGQSHGAVPVPSTSFSYTQGFDSLPTSSSATSSNSTWTNNSTIAGWSIFAGDAANVGYTPNNLALPIAVGSIRTANGSSGSDRANANYGTVNSTDRSIGFQTGSTHQYDAAFTNISDAPPSIFGYVSVAFRNDTASTLGGFDASYTGEQWRYGAASSSSAQELTFQYAIAPAATLASGLVWISPAAAAAKPAGRNFVSKINSGTSRSLDGNAAASRTTGLGATVEGLTWAPGHLLYLRWFARNHSGSDNGLAIDDLSFSVLASNFPEIVMTAPGNGATIDAPSSIALAAGATAASGATISKVEFYRGGIFLGEDTTVPYEGSWTTPFNGVHTFTAIAEDNQNRRSASPAVSITVTGQPTVPPSVLITSPADTAIVDSPASFTISANASDTDGVVTKVEFFVNSIKIGEDLTAPFQFNVGPLFTGTYALAATATDDGGAVTTDDIEITVQNTDNVAPTVAMTFPLDASTVFATSANLTVNAADSDGVIAKVEYYEGANKLGENTSAPFNFQWLSIAPGLYNLSAVATDNDGRTTTSAPINVTFDDSAFFSYVENFNGMGTSTAPPAGWNHFGTLGGAAASWNNTTGIPASGTISAATPGTLNNTLSVQSAAATFTGSSGTQAYNAALADSTGDRALATSPTGVAGNVLQLSLVNTALKAITRIDVGYDIRRFSAVTTVNELPGYWLFYSLDNGATWTNVDPLNPLLAGTEVNVPNTVGVTVVRNKPVFLNSPWAPGATALFRWVDDNADVASPDQFTGLDNVSITGSRFLNGTAPVVALVSPAGGTAFPSNPTITLTASATDTDGTVSLVEFFANGTKIGESDTAPYSFTWISPASASYTLTARATDDDGDFSTSAPVSIIVQAPPGIVAGPWTGAVTHQSATVGVALTAPSINTRVILSTSTNLSNPVFSATVISTSTLGNSVKIPLTGLSPLTTYHYAIELNGVAQTSGDLQGKFTTFPVPGAASYRVAFGSCGSYSNASQYVYEGIVNDNPLFFMHMGDMNYQDVNSVNPDDYRTVYNAQITSGQLRRVCRAMGMTYMWDDHDYAGNDSNKNNIGRTATRQVYRERFPHYPLAAGGPDAAIYQTFNAGRVRYIITDLRSERDPISQTDNATKSMMGAAQKVWFKQQLIDARDSEVPLIVWNSSVPFISTSTSGDDWGRYQTERLELLQFIRDEKIQNIVVISGDMHALSLDDGQGTNSYLAGVRIPVFHGAALAQSGSSKGGPYRVGAGTVTPSQGLGRYGVFDITDTGANISAVFRGRIASGSGSAWTSTADWEFLSGQSSFTYNAEPVRPRTAKSPVATPAINVIRLAWQDDSTVETGYRIERRAAGSGSFALVETVAAGTVQYSDAGVTPGTAYDYRVVAVNQSIEAAPSVIATATALSAWENFKLANLGNLNGEDTDDSDDNDGLALILEFAFGLNPALRDNLPLVGNVAANELTTRGVPTLLEPQVGGDGKFHALYIRRKNLDQAGIICIPQFTGDLEDWGIGQHAPVVIATDGDYELVSERFPDTINGKVAKFFRMSVKRAQP